MKVNLASTTQSGNLSLDEQVAFVARVSNPSNQFNHETADKLVQYLVKHKHFSPLEMVNVCFEIETTRDIARQILRHRSFCLGADSVIWFDLPDENSELNYKPYKKSISYLHDRFHNGAKPLPNGIRMPMKERIKSMNIRCVNEDTGEITHTHINDITKSRAELHKVTFINGNSVTSSMNHKYYTDKGWLTLQEAIKQKVKFVAQGQKTKEKPKQLFPEIDESKELWMPIKDWDNYEVSNMGRVRRLGKHSQGKLRKGSISKSNGYPVISFNKPDVQIERNMQRVVLETFKPLESYEGLEARHINHNKLDCRLENLEWGTSSDNRNDSVATDTHGRLRTNLTEIASVEYLGEQDSYDISVDAPWHNFVCDGQIVHNSFQEFSQRYADVNELSESVFREARLQDTDNRQNSLETENKELQLAWAQQQSHASQTSREAYNWALNKGIAKEIARAVLPEGITPSRMYMNGSLRSWLHYIEVRTHESTQKEHREVALEVQKQLRELAPNIFGGEAC